MNQSEIFAHLLAKSLLESKVGTGQTFHFVVTARLRMSAGKIPIEIRIPWEFSDLRQNPPVVFCREHWMREGPEWHNEPPMCWVLAAEWRRNIGWQGKPVQEIMEEGARWLFNGVKCLIERHHYAHQHGITKWPPEWPCWDHYNKGTQDYERQQRRT